MPWWREFDYNIIPPHHRIAVCGVLVPYPGCAGVGMPGPQGYWNDPVTRPQRYRVVPGRRKPNATSFDHTTTTPRHNPRAVPTPPHARTTHRAPGDITLAVTPLKPMTNRFAARVHRYAYNVPGLVTEV